MTDAEPTYVEAKRALAAGAVAEAERLARAAVAARPGEARPYFLLGEALAAAGRVAEALAAYDRAAALNPGLAPAFTRASIIRFRSRFGAPPAPRASVPGQDRVQMTTLGGNGRFGNQLLQYAFVKLYAEQHGLALEVPDWIGRDLFDRDDPLPTQPLPLVDESAVDLFGALHGRAAVLRNVNVRGYFAGLTAAWAGFEQRFRALFSPGRRVRPLLDAAAARLRSRGRTVVAVHLRRGDFGYGRFWVAPAAWYLDWLAGVWPTLERPVLYVATDEPAAAAAFRAFEPVCGAELACELPGAGYMLDHFVLGAADHLAIANSSFSFTAAMLNARGGMRVRPHPDRCALVPFDPWNAPVLLDPVVAPGAVAAAERAAMARLIRPADVVVHVGRHCAPWTNELRRVHPALRVFELDEDASLDRFCERAPGTRVHYAVVERAEALGEVVRKAPRALARADLDLLHFRVAAGAVEPAALGPARDAGYECLRLSEHGLAPLGRGGVPEPATILAVRASLRDEFERRMQG